MITIKEALETKGLVEAEFFAKAFEMDYCPSCGKHNPTHDLCQACEEDIFTPKQYVCSNCKESFEEELFNYMKLCPCCDEALTAASSVERPFEAVGVYLHAQDIIVTDDDDLPF